MLILLIILLALVFLSIRERVASRVKRSEEKEPSLPEPRSSPLSEAIVEFVGTAGGIYLALIMLINFLKITVPERASFFGVKLDPVAALSIFLTIIQPFLNRLLPTLLIWTWPSR
ncbi:MAG: hypothetical protein HPY71_08615 [Firmicutes bacterium]|nr:hypothetical protein [Bacillota bacterium]